MTVKRAVLSLALVLAAPLFARADVPEDPLGSPVWKDVAKAHLGTGEIVFDDRVKVLVPGVVENQAQVPIVADARLLPNVQKLVVIADLNPIRHVLTLKPAGDKAHAFVSFRMKIEQATPVRAAAMTSDGVWHVGGVFLEFGRWRLLLARHGAGRSGLVRYGRQRAGPRLAPGRRQRPHAPARQASDGYRARKG